MKAEAIVQRGGPVARTLKISGSTHAMVGALSATVALNGVLSALALGTFGSIVVVAVVFVSLAACSAAIFVDVLRRSGKAVTDLRSIGASRRTISSALFGSVFAYGAAGSAAGGIAGAAIGGALMGAVFGVNTLMVVFAVIGASAAALASGSYAGGRVVWPS